MDQLSQYMPGILLAFTAFVLGIFSPGPNILAVIGTSMSKGRREGKALALGVAGGSLLWGLLTWFGLTTVLTLYASVLTIIKIAGGMYLLWLAFKAFKSAASSREMSVRQLGVSGSALAYFRRGIVIQMTNPKAALTWIAVMSLGVDATAPFWVGGLIVAGTTIISTIGHLTYAVAFSTMPMVKAYRRARRWIEAGLGMFFCFASYKLLTSRT